MTDAALIERFLDGDVGAFNALVWRWEKPLYNFIYRNIGNEDTAKDLCQTAFIRMFKEMKRLRNPNSFSAWMYRIAINLCRDEYKRRKRGRVLYLEDSRDHEDNESLLKQMPDQETKTPEELCHQQQVGDILKRMLMALPEEQRIVIVMKQYQGLKFTEIASILDQPINTIKSRLYYGLRALKKMLEESQLAKEVLFHEM
jgi:RNA polymerase sigma-70 factor (ECF subfamily)